VVTSSSRRSNNPMKLPQTTPSMTTPATRNGVSSLGCVGTVIVKRYSFGKVAQTSGYQRYLQAFNGWVDVAMKY
jgi:hypothetical protein